MKKIQIIFLCFVLIFGVAACTEEASTPGSSLPQTQQAKKTAEETKEEALLTLDGGKISILSIKGIDGPFVEKGERIEAENIACVVIRNNSDEMLEYGSFSFRVNQYERADFSISALGAGENAVVMESLARPYSDGDKYEIDGSSVITAYKKAQTKSEKVELTTENNVITIKNISDETVTATVIYKYYKDGMYYGGIAFSGRFEDIGPGETVSKTSDSFDESCRIVNLTVE